ncbi:MAG: divergent PAP2 family protein [Bacillota bacterium]|nr:divergent PAP2 family protein [Bacillota bacterium]MDD3298687.1 divergent PAP2 family protein [Bacillota bacterium]MDD3850534.1 divergent PAP2 family protein [Bacillota bacterium]MDD4707664.1 divergent PAP2 family protein [Bacillota bacterium]
MSFFSRVLENRVLIIALVAWTVAQVGKVIFEIRLNKRVDLRRFVGSGGMPSSHSAFVMALSTSVGRMQGWDSPLFAIAISYAFVVMYDAAGVRRAAGKQAEILNIIIKDVIEHKVLEEERLRELIGHTPIEVIIGGIIGIIIANIMV